MNPLSTKQIEQERKGFEGPYEQHADGSWHKCVPLPFYYGLIPFLYLRLKGYRDREGRKAQFIGWRNL